MESNCTEVVGQKPPFRIAPNTLVLALHQVYVCFQAIGEDVSTSKITVHC